MVKLSLPNRDGHLMIARSWRGTGIAWRSSSECTDSFRSRASLCLFHRAMVDSPRGRLPARGVSLQPALGRISDLRPRSFMEDWTDAQTHSVVRE